VRGEATCCRRVVRSDAGRRRRRGSDVRDHGISLPPKVRAILLIKSPSSLPSARPSCCSGVEGCGGALAEGPGASTAALSHGRPRGHLRRRSRGRPKGHLWRRIRSNIRGDLRQWPTRRTVRVERRNRGVRPAEQRVSGCSGVVLHQPPSAIQVASSTASVATSPALDRARNHGCLNLE